MAFTHSNQLKPQSNELFNVSNTQRKNIFVPEPIAHYHAFLFRLWQMIKVTQ